MSPCGPKEASGKNATLISTSSAIFVYIYFFFKINYFNPFVVSNNSFLFLVVRPGAPNSVLAPFVAMPFVPVRSVLAPTPR